MTPPDCAIRSLRSPPSGFLRLHLAPLPDGGAVVAAGLGIELVALGRDRLRGLRRRLCRRHRRQRRCEHGNSRECRNRDPWRSSPPLGIECPQQQRLEWQAKVPWRGSSRAAAFRIGQASSGSARNARAAASGGARSRARRRAARPSRSAGRSGNSGRQPSRRASGANHCSNRRAARLRRRCD